jgi:hypothetical protein
MNFRIVSRGVVLLQVELIRGVRSVFTIGAAN